ncbi:MAG: ZIP family metal transporter [Clostridia bacterium]|nr:ZIP family metal transporter [Clostridia bacterium]
MTLCALAATTVGWLVTALGALLSLAVGGREERAMAPTLGFAGGVMCAASFWSLLAPAAELAGELSGRGWLPTTAGFLCGALTLGLLGEIFRGKLKDRGFLMVLSVTLHNLPEGLAVGVAFGAVAAGLSGADAAGAWMLAVGIALQNLPEGFAVAAPLRRAGLPRWKSFFWGQASGLVEPVGGVLGCALVGLFRPALPFALSYAAGAMIWVVFAEIAPEACASRRGMAGLVAGFGLMMLMDLAL